MKTKIIWRLKEQPSPTTLRDLVKDGILSTHEAREILFSSENSEDRDKKSLESEIKFLRDLVEKLSSGRTQIVETIREVIPSYKRWDWGNPYVTWSDNGGLQITSGSATDLTNTVQTSGGGITSTNQNFSDIKTF